MNSEEFINLTDHMHKEEKDEYRKKNADYADREGKNILANFERVSKHLNITPQMALLIYMEKHMDAIRSYIRYGSVMSEPIEGRIKDARVYLSLLRAMVEQGKSVKREDKVLAIA